MSMSVHEATTKAMKNITIILLLLVSVAQAQPSITQMEYWIGTDPGIGIANPITLPTQQPDINFIQTLSPSLNLGINYVGYRSKDANNVWSHTNFITLFVADSAHSKIVEVEYFWDVDSGFNAAVDSIFANPVNDISNGILYANVPLNLGLGSHILFVRSKDNQSRWSHTNYVDSVNVYGTVSLNELFDETGISVNPNPFNDVISVSSKSIDSFRFILYEMSGRKIIDKIVRGNGSIQTSELTSGTYTLVLWTTEKKIFRTTLIKQ